MKILEPVVIHTVIWKNDIGLVIIAKFVIYDGQLRNDGNMIATGWESRKWGRQLGIFMILIKAFVLL